jgi:formylglycine-generating enzyme required for sulfatase activity
LVVGFLVGWGGIGHGAQPKAGAPARVAVLEPARTPAAFHYQATCLAAAIDDLSQRHGAAYPGGEDYRARLAGLRQRVPERPAEPGLVDAATWDALQELKRAALLANPALRDLESILVVKRKARPVVKAGGNPLLAASRGPGLDVGLPSNHECNSSLERTGYDNEIAAFAPRAAGGPLRTIYRPAQSGYVGEMDLHPDADRLLFTESGARNWAVHEIRVDGTAHRPVTRLPEDVDCYDACYLPDGRVVFGSSAAMQAVPCWHGLKVVSNLYLANADGTGVRRLCYDQDHNLHAAVMPNGQLVYSRWDYTGIGHIFLRQLMMMNPDGTGQRAVYGSNSYFPNALYFPRAMPGRAGEMVCILSGYHGVHRMGHLVIVDTNRGWNEADGIVRRISGRGDPVRPEVKDDLVSADWPRFLHPYPLDENTLLVAAWLNPKSDWAIFVADRFDNLVPLRAEAGYALLEPVPVRRTAPPPRIPDRVDTAATESVVYLHDVYAGPGLAGVPRGTVKALRVVGYHFGYPGLAGPHLIGRGGPWEVMRILGTVPVEEDGSAAFRIPANTPLALQALDAEGKAVQLMRSWYTGMPGEKVSCIGCHESPSQVPVGKVNHALTRTPVAITPWRGPARGFDFEREVQGVLDAHCVACHSEDGRARPDLRPLAAFPNYQGQKPDDLGVKRMHPAMKEATAGFIKHTPAYEALLPYIRRVSIEDEVRLLVPGEYHADTSELIQMLRKGHHGVRLDAESWDRLITWIDLNAPCHGTWGEVFPIPDRVHERRMELNRLTGGPALDPEVVPMGAAQFLKVTAMAAPQPGAAPLRVKGWPFTPDEARARQQALGITERTVDLGGGVSLQLRRIPAGRFVLGAEPGAEDERPQAAVAIDRPFWMAAGETTNEQFRRFDPTFDCRDYQKRHARDDDMGLPLNGPRQPAVRVSWEQAMAFCTWLSRETGLSVSLPTEAQWEWACRAGAGGAFSFGEVTADFAPWANLADVSFSRGHRPDGGQVSGGLEHLILEGAALSDRQHNDQHRVTAPVGSFRPNAWGLFDLHGNAAEWTRSAYRPYPYDEHDGRKESAGAPAVRRVVRGGSFFDRPARAQAFQRLAYPAWQRVFNVGFRVIVEEPGMKPAAVRREVE